MAEASSAPETEEERVRRIAFDQPPFARLLGLRIVSAERDRVVAEFEARPDFGNRNGVLHGGALMGIADNLGGTAASLNLPAGATTSTIESKTNFLAAVPMGETARAECTPLHRGRTTQVWQTRILRADGKVAALVTQTQLVMQGRAVPHEAEAARDPFPDASSSRESDPPRSTTR